MITHGYASYLEILIIFFYLSKKSKITIFVKTLPFGVDEIVLRLHDEGDDGRLFRMAEF